MIWIGAIFLMILGKEDEFHTISYRYCCAHSEGSGFKWFMHPVISFWLSGAGGGLERGLLLSKGGDCCQMLDQDESPHEGSGLARVKSS